MPKSTGVKYLGVKLENSLRWNENTSFITGKASSRFGCIWKTIPSSLPHLRDRANKYLFRPVTEYCSTVWDGNLTTTQENSIEATQRRAARLVNNMKRTDYVTSTTALIGDLEWEMLKTRREKRRLRLFRAMHFDEVAVSITDQSRKHQLQNFIPHCNTKLHQNSFFVSTAEL